MWTIVFVVGILLVLGFGRLIGLSGIIWGFLGVISSTVGAGSLWGVGAALLTGGLSLSYWGHVCRGMDIFDTPLIVRTHWFGFFTNSFSLVLIILGLILLLI